jgi:hypothetical protein
MSFDVEHCKMPKQRCDGCAITMLEQGGYPVAAEQTLAMIGRFGLGEVATAIKKQETSHDAYDFGVMFELAKASGESIPNEEDLVTAAVKLIVAQHGNN